MMIFSVFLTKRAVTIMNIFFPVCSVIFPGPNLESSHLSEPVIQYISKALNDCHV